MKKVDFQSKKLGIAVAAIIVCLFGAFFWKLLYTPQINKVQEAQQQVQQNKKRVNLLQRQLAKTRKEPSLLQSKSFTQKPVFANGRLVQSYLDKIQAGEEQAHVAIIQLSATDDRHYQSKINSQVQIRKMNISYAIQGESLKSILDFLRFLEEESFLIEPLEFTYTLGNQESTTYTGTVVLQFFYVARSEKGEPISEE